MFDTSRRADRPVEVLLRICEAARLLRLSDGRLYAEVPVGDRRETYALLSKRFRRWLIHGYRGDCGKVPSGWPILRVLGALEASASFDGNADNDACLFDDVFDARLYRSSGFEAFSRMHSRHPTTRVPVAGTP